MTFNTSATAGHDQKPLRETFKVMAFRPWQIFVDAMTRRRTYAALSALDDHLLKDIGISRSEIDHISRSLATGSRLLLLQAPR